MITRNLSRLLTKKAELSWNPAKWGRDANDSGAAYNWSDLWNGVGKGLRETGVGLWHGAAQAGSAFIRGGARLADAIADKPELVEAANRYTQNMVDTAKSYYDTDAYEDSKAFRGGVDATGLLAGTLAAAGGAHALASGAGALTAAAPAAVAPLATAATKAVQVAPFLTFRAGVQPDVGWREANGHIDERIPGYQEYYGGPVFKAWDNAMLFAPATEMMPSGMAWAASTANFPGHAISENRQAKGDLRRAVGVGETEDPWAAKREIDTALEDVMRGAPKTESGRALRGEARSMLQGLVDAELGDKLNYLSDDEYMDLLQHVWANDPEARQTAFDDALAVQYGADAERFRDAERRLHGSYMMGALSALPVAGAAVNRVARIPAVAGAINTALPTPGSKAALGWLAAASAAGAAGGDVRKDFAQDQADSAKSWVDDWKAR